MKFSIASATLALLAAMPAVHAHMSMLEPAPIRHPKNPNTSNPDSDYSSPINQAKFPCKGYHLESGKEMTPTATWAAGSSQTFKLSGGAAHAGGSCQASISEDGGQTFKVLKSYIGNCPNPSGETGGNFDFVVPKETKSGNVLFAWTWFNKLGVREMYMNCASVEITGGGSGLTGDQFPDIFTANVGNGCTTAESKDVLIPNPGPNVDMKSPDAVAPEGTCQAGTGPVTPPPTQPPAEPEQPQPPVEQPPVEQPPVQQPPVEQPPVQQPPVLTPPPSGGSCTDGQVICKSASTWALCAGGSEVFMGNVAAGTTCSNGQITKRSVVRSSEHMKRRF